MTAEVKKLTKEEKMEAMRKEQQEQQERYEKLKAEDPIALAKEELRHRDIIIEQAIAGAFMLISSIATITAAVITATSAANKIDNTRNDDR